MKKLLLSGIILCSSAATADSPTKNISEPEEWITVIIHGTIMPSFNLFDLQVLSSATTPKKTRLEQIHNLYRKSPFFFLVQPMQGLGLKPLYFSNEKHESASLAFAHTLQKLNADFFPERAINHFYTFGWSGLLNDYARDEAANLLWKELLKETSKLKKTTSRPLHICILAYSYGGSMCLQLANKVNDAAPEFTIDELILFAMPVRYECYTVIYSPLFKKIYSDYSDGDRIQTFDILSGTRPNRTFDSKIAQDIVGKNLPESLHQIKIRFNARNRPFKENKEYPLFARRQLDPGHIEMWLFGWTHRWYRHNLPIFPLPVAALAPYISYTANQYPEIPSMSLEISPRSGQTIIKSIDEKCPPIFFKYDLPKTKIDVLIGIAREFKPLGYCMRHKKKWRALVKDLNKMLKQERFERCIELSRQQSKTCQLCHSTDQSAQQS